jgi:hypothetical protein
VEPRKLQQQPSVSVPCKLLNFNPEQQEELSKLWPHPGNAGLYTSPPADRDQAVQRHERPLWVDCGRFYRRARILRISREAPFLASDQYPEFPAMIRSPVFLTPSADGVCSARGLLALRTVASGAGRLGSPAAGLGAGRLFFRSAAAPARCRP